MDGQFPYNTEGSFCGSGVKPRKDHIHSSIVNKIKIPSHTKKESAII